ncbi:MAG TPA: tRNA uridine-5-carboxymethylaminomethyl(34) synthesis GTPase MnmE [Candidatus Eisenbacteria bacterium]
MDDTIAAVATGGGPAGLAVVRLSGGDALRLADQVFRGATRLSDAGSHTLHHGWATWPDRGVDRSRRAGKGPAPAGEAVAPAGGARLDEVVVSVFRAPRSYTREDVVEFSCHGGEWPARRIRAALLEAGARLARPGEFTLRAFLSGRIDLAQAEAVADLIQASTARAHELALSQLAGDLSRTLNGLAERIADAAAEVEARVDFAEDVGGAEVPPHVVTAIGAAHRGLAELLAGAHWARAVREGVRVALVGRPNVGKSSLFNALVGEPRAIVTPIPGTTRDRVSEAIELAGIRVTLSDTAGLRDGAGPVETMGIAITEQAIDGSAAVLWVVDGSVPLGREDCSLARRLEGRRVLAALNKCDRPAVVRDADLARSSAVDLGRSSGAEPWPVVAVSATRGDGLEALRAALAKLLGAGEDERALAASVGNPRHVEALGRAREALGRAAGAAGAAPGEIVALELREALEAIGEVTGRSAGEDLLERIFARFCIGK